jgi:hypothetical protein
MKTNDNFNLAFDEISPSEYQNVYGGFAPEVLLIASGVISLTAGILGLAFFAGYTYGKLTCDQ